MNCGDCKHLVFNRCTITGSYSTSDKVCNGWELSASHEIVKRSKIMAETTKRLNSEEFADMLDSYCNNFSTDFRQGVEIGKNLQVHHRTIQATVFRFLIGILVGIGKDVQPNRMDARNEQAVICSIQIADMMEDEHLVIGRLI